VDHDIDRAFAELGLSPDATDREVKAAWRRLVSQWHPDRNSGADAVARMQRINRALEAIRQAGPRKPEASTGANGAAAASDSDAAKAADPADEARSSDEPQRTVHRKVRLTLEEAAFGCTKVLRGEVTDDCLACEGAGYRVLGGHCPQCHGSGAIRQPMWFAWVGTPAECEACRGGGIARQPCAACAGSGKAATQRYQVTVRFPHGVRDGDMLGVASRRGKPGAPPGDLSIRVDLLEHALFKLDPDGTVRCDMPVDGYAWLAGRTLDVPTLDGLQTIQLQRDQLIHRLAGQGFPVDRRGPRGDQLITLQPIFPQRMTADQQILIDQLIATTTGADGKPSDERLRGWSEALGAWKRGGGGGRG
jgi:molecular chaperone DnaJ